MKISITKHILAIALVAATLLLPPATSLAGENDTELAAGISLVKKGYYKEGAAVLRKVIGQYPDDAEANYYLGMALNRTAPNKEAESYLKRSLMEFPENPGINFELGTHYFEKDVHAEAADYFEQVVELVPGTEMAAKSAEYLQKINESKKEKSWELSIFAGGQYDSNVIVNGTGMPIPQGYSGKSDWSAIVNLKANYSPLKTEQAEIGFGYSFYQNIHASLSDFDIMQNLLDLSGSYAVNSNLTVKGVYSFEYLLLNNNQYDTAHNLAPSLLIKSDIGTTTIDYRFRNTTYKDSDQFTTNSDRNGNNNLIGATHILPLSDTAAAWALYTFDGERTKKQEWDYYGNRFLVGIRSLLPFGLIGDLSGELYLKDYRGVDPAYAATRHDTQYTFSVSLMKNLSERYSVSLSEVWSSNNCNIPDFEYDRSITSLLLNAKF